MSNEIEYRSTENRKPNTKEKQRYHITAVLVAQLKIRSKINFFCAF